MYQYCKQTSTKHIRFRVSICFRLVWRVSYLAIKHRQTLPSITVLQQSVGACSLPAAATFTIHYGCPYKGGLLQVHHLRADGQKEVGHQRIYE